MSYVEFVNIIKRLYRRRGRVAFLETVTVYGKVLDVGCGYNSPGQIKSQRPDIKYVGLDVCDHNIILSPHDVADEYIVTNPDGFAKEITKLSGKFDAVVSSHNLEHCNEPDAVLQAMINSLKEGGKLYLAFPCEESINFPHRKGTLNFYDDSSHINIPNFNKICVYLEERGLHIEFAAKRYRPMVPFVIGVLIEPISYLRKRVSTATWALYGFESVIWASRAK